MDIDQFEAVKRQYFPRSKVFTLFYFFWIGGSCSIAWGSVINSIDYFEAKFPNDNVSFLFPIPTYVANILLIAFITYLSKKLSYSFRVILSLIITMALEIIIPFEAQSLANTGSGIRIMIVLLLFLGFFSNMSYATICGFTSQVGSLYTAWFMVGIACFGLVMNLTKEATLLIYKSDDAGDINSILAYFGMTLIFIGIGLILHISFMRSDFYKFEFKPIVDPLPNSDMENSDSQSPLTAVSPSKRYEKNVKTLFSTFLECKVYIALMFVANLQHNTFYPGVMLLKSMPTLAKTTKTVSLVTTFNVFYIIGKALGQFRNRYNLKTVVILVLIRFIFDGLFIAQVVDPDTPVIGSIWFAYINVALFSVTLGFLIVALIIMTPEQVVPEKKEIAGFVAVIGNNVGTMCGAFLSLTLKNLSP